jgi:putative ABC transport system permease protein
MLGDLRYALRGLRRSPGFAAAAICSLALGIGLNSAVFIVVRASLFPDPGFRDPAEVVQFPASASNGDHGAHYSWAEVRAYRDGATAFQDLAVRRFARFSLAVPGESASYVVADLVTPNYFRLLGVRPMLGRDFQSGDDAAILIPYTLWRSQFGGDPQVIGKTALLTGRPVTIIGVLPENWRGGFRRIFVPLGAEVLARTTDLEVIARLRRGVSMEAAKAQVAAISRRLEEQFPNTNRGWTASLVPEGPVFRERLQEERGRLLAMLFAAVGFVLLIACVNIAALLLARAAVRRKELALRRALGATRGRIVRQWLIESLLLAFFAGVAGLLLAHDGGLVIARLWKIELPANAEAGLAAFVSIATLLSSLLFGVIPAWQAAASDALALHTGRNVHPGAMRLRSALIVGEISLALPLLVGAGLAVRSFAALSRIDPGFDPHHLLAMRIQFVDPKFKDDRRKAAYFREVIDRVSGQPGVRAAAWVDHAPAINSGSRVHLRLEGDPPFSNGSHLPIVNLHEGTSGFLSAMGLSIRRGRDFSPQDSNKVLVNEAFARRFFPGRDPIGKRIATDAENQDWHEIIGVAPSIIEDDIRSMVQPEPEVIAMEAVPSSGPWLLVRTAGDPGLVVSGLRHALASVDRDTPEANLQMLDQVLPDTIAPQRSLAGILAGFACLALVLAVVGIYGVMSYFVVQRSRDVGIRVALGAQPRDILNLVLGRSLRLAAAGVAIGCAISFALERVLAGLFFGVSASDPLNFAGAGLLLTLVAILAAAIPARRAIRLDPIDTLRSE